MKAGLSKKTIKIIVTLIALIFALVIVLHHNPLAVQQEENIKKTIACVIIAAAVLVFWRFYDRIVSLPVELWQSRHLIWKLAKNDFKTRYAGSYLGRIWAFVQPVVTVVLYWFVFDYIMNAKKEFLSQGIDVPYLLWLMAGLVPWFYFSEAINNGMTSLLEYSYLVKKVVFKISIIPIIKIIAATFTHLFFVAFMLVVYFVYGYEPSIYLIQLPYYTFCMFMIVLAISYSTCAIVIFFRDLTQIVSIALQIGMWATPILWNINRFENPIVQTIIKINPIFYIVNGYRSAMYEQTWFWQDFYSTMYFWIVTVVLFGVGALIFRRLKVHFADVL
ncbi:MAG: ABC transporter permease [Lachnospiraceae bacterium]|nr:ABC transporter permease [Lachnospiraceae bacterium]